MFEVRAGLKTVPAYFDKLARRQSLAHGLLVQRPTPVSYRWASEREHRPTMRAGPDRCLEGRSHGPPLYGEPALESAAEAEARFTKVRRPANSPTNRSLDGLLATLPDLTASS